MLDDKNTFLEEFNLSPDYLEEHKINWNTLLGIYKDYEESIDKLEEYAEFVGRMLRNHKDVHTVRTRVKDKKNLIAKLIRKIPDRRKNYGKDFHFTIDNYKNEITDLVGVRVIHMFKEDWENIHEFINQTWEVTESIANVREGDNEEIYSSRGLEVNSRETGYRSVHYLVELKPTKEKITSEIQVRTIFEEGYGEIDHQLRYPNFDVPEPLKLNLAMLNRLAGSADEMASTVQMVKNEWEEMQKSYQEAYDEKEREINSLKQKIKDLDIEQEEKESIYKGIDSLSITSNDYNTYKNTNFDFTNTQGTSIKLSALDKSNLYRNKLPRKISLNSGKSVVIDTAEENKDD